MKTIVTSNFENRISQAAITLIEMLVSVSLLLVIILGLYFVFQQVQKAFRFGNTQVDVLEGMRSTLNIIKSDFDQVAISPSPYGTNLFITNSGPPALVMVNIDGTTRTNNFDSVYFLTFNSGWYGVGYRIGDSTNPLGIPTSGIGTLYRYQTLQSNSFRFMVDSLPQDYYTNLSGPFMNPLLFTNLFQRVMDGVVHFRVRAPWQTNVVIGGIPSTVQLTLPAPGTNVNFIGTNLPSRVDLEIGIVEPPLADQVRALPPFSATNFLTAPNNADRVHYFQIPLTLHPGT